MPSAPDPLSNPPGGAQCFEPTQWSIVLAAGKDQPDAREALQRLCTIYWYPLYAFVRRQRHNPQDAQDLTQEFFARLLEKQWLAGVDRSKGRFRSFLLAAMKHFLANEWDHARAQKRGGGKIPISLDTMTAESRYALEPAALDTPERVFERRWALTLLDQVLTRLRGEFAAAGKIHVFEELKSSLTGGSAPYSEIAAKLEMSEGAVKVAVHRLRARYRDLVRAEVAQTVDSDGEIEDELRSLMAAL
ncbi:MAG TPA: RNA polymerase sigma factor [Tepidisphaeraceae bacterium]|jgi:RNA polymerase sigma-70 factor (ECF subfamily)|nr:RNA polymerase sigma factor [Tepidisphaeraceae bacterium]